MRINNNYIYHLLFIGLIIAFIGCKKRDPLLIEQYIGFKLPNNMVEEHFFKAEYSPDYLKPYNIYGKYKISFDGLESIRKNTQLVGHSQDYKKIMCLENVSVYAFPYDVWSFKTRFNYLSRNEFATNLKWWNPEVNNGVLYAAFYKEKGPIKIVRCYNKKWDGRILISYNKETEEAYIMIEVLL